MTISNWVEKIRKDSGFPSIKTAADARRHLADKLGCSEVLVRHWCNGNREVKAEWVISICRATDGQVTPHELNPDIYPDPKWLPSLNQGQKAA